MAYIVMNKKCCDNSTHCWYIHNCPNHVFSFGENNQITYDETKCTGCKECLSHCPISRVALTLEEKTILESILMVDCHKINAKIFGAEPIAYPNEVLLYDFKQDNFDECLQTIKSSRAVLFIELLDENVVCKISGIPFDMLEDELTPLLSRFMIEPFL